MDMKNWQREVTEWMNDTFTPEIVTDTKERNYRFLEEALELVQALGCTREEVNQLADYVFGRDAGEVAQEVGGVMVTLTALCNAADVNLNVAATDELDRASDPEVQARIRQKQLTKPKFSPLPGAG